MARNASGTYTLPSGNPVVSGTLIDATWANNTLSDLGNEMTDSLSRSGEGAMLAPLRITDGVQATPSLAFSNEPSSGLYRAGSNEWWAVAAGVQNLRFTNTGLTTRAAAGAVGTPSLAAFNDTDTGIYFPGANELAIATGGAARMTFDSAGAVTIPGTLSVTSSSTLTGSVKIGNGVASNTSLLMVNRPSGNPTGVQLFQDGVESWIMGMAASSSTLTWAASGSTKMSLTSLVFSTDSSINVGIGTASPAYKVDASGQVRALESGTGSGDGSFVASTSGANGNAGVLFQTNSASRWNLTTAGTNGANLRIYNYALASTVATFDSSGNLGLGVTPSAWISGALSLDVRSTSSFADVGGSTTIANNSYRNSSGNWIYKTTNFASRYETDTGQHRWSIAPSGTAGNTISFSTAMTLDASGNVGIGTASPANYANYRNLAISGTTGANIDMLSGSTKVGNLFNDATNFYAYNVTAGALVFGTNNAEVGRFTAAGNLGIGTASPVAKLSVQDASVPKIALQVGGAERAFLSYTESNFTTRLDSDGPLVFAANNAEVGRFDVLGNLGIGTASPATKVEVYGGASGTATNLTVGNANTAFVFGVDTSNNCQIRTAQNVSMIFYTNATNRGGVDGAGNWTLGGGTLATSATDGFLYVPTCAGTPTGTPTTKTGFAPIVINTTNNKLYFYSGGSWRDAGP